MAERIDYTVQKFEGYPVSPDDTLDDILGIKNPMESFLKKNPFLEDSSPLPRSESETKKTAMYPSKRKYEGPQVNYEK